MTETRTTIPEISRRRLLVAACAGLFVFGMALVLLGTLFGLPEMRVRLQLDVVRQGELASLLFVGVLLATVVAGPLIDRFGNKAVLAISAALVAMALAAFAFAEGFRAATLIALALGAGGGGLNIATNVVVSDAYGDARGPMLNVLGMFFGVGAVLIPLLAAGLLANHLTALMLIAAALAAATALGYAVLPFPPAREAHSFSLRGVVKVARYPAVLLFGILLFFESGNESSLTNFSSTWMGAAGASPRTATAALAGFQLAMMVGRLLAARLLRAVSKTRLVFASGLGTAAGCALMLGSRSAAAMFAAIVLTGFACAAIYPTTLAMAGDRYQRFSGTVFGVLFSIALFGSILAPAMIGYLSRDLGLRYGVVTPLIGAVMVCAAVKVIGGRERKEGQAG